MRRRTPAGWLAVVLIIGAVSLLPHVAAAGIIQYQQGGSGSDGPQHLVVGVVSEGREIGFLEVVRVGSEFLLPVGPFADLVGIDVRPFASGLNLVTPLGTVQVFAAEMVEIEGVRYLPTQLLESRLAVRVTFDEAEFALVLDLPWRRGAPLPGQPERRVPDVRPPEASLSSLWTDTDYTIRDPGDGTWRTDNVLGGRIAGGRWRMRYSSDFDEVRDLREYAWLGVRDDTLLLLGQQRTQVHPILNSLEFTGAQVGWTNQPLELFQPGPEPRELLPRQLQPISTFRGPGPPGGVAELRIDGITVARQNIGLDGTYEFLDVPLGTRQTSRIEVLVFDRANLQIPVAVYEEQLSASQYLLDEHARMFLAGAGVQGNVVQDRIDGVHGHERASGFVQWREAVSRNLTFEAAAEHNGLDTTQGMAGFVARLGESSIASLGLGTTDTGALAYDATFESYRGPWRLLGQSRYLEAGYRGADSDRYGDHYLELGYAADLRFDASLVGHSRSLGGERVEYLLPALRWRPFRGASLFVRPDAEGDYTLDGFLLLPNRHAIAASIRDQTTLEYRLPTSESSQLALGGSTGGGQPDRYSVTFGWLSAATWRTEVVVGALYAEGEYGYQAGVRWPVRPGVLARLDAFCDPLQTVLTGRRSQQISLGVTLDLAFAGGGVLAARTQASRYGRGAIAGKVAIEGPKALQRFPLDHLNILVNGRIAGQTGEGGSFYISYLPAGIYTVSLDTGNLPLELAPVTGVVVAEVAEAAVTRVDFAVRPEFGIAGRVRDTAGRAVPGVTLELVDDAGQPIADATTDRFGLYRVDGLPPGSYRLQVADAWRPDATRPLPTRPIDIRDGFLFNQDLQLPIVVPSDPEQPGAEVAPHP